MTIEYKDSKRIVGLSKSTTVANTKSISSQTTNVIDLAVKPDGTEIYVATEDTGKVITYELATAGDVSTAVYNSSKDYTHSLTNPKGMDWNNDGTKIYLASFNTEKVHTYTVSTAYDLSSTVTQVGTGVDLSGIDSAQGLQWSHDGAYLFLADNSGVIFRYQVSSAFVVSDGTRTSFNPSETTAVTGISFGDNGKEMYIVSHANTGLFKYTLSTAYDLSTATHDSTLTTTDADNQGIATSNGKIYVLGQTTDIVTDYNNDIRPTDIQDNSILVEKDTGKRYWFSENKVSTSELKAHYNFDSIGGGTTLTNQATTGDGLGSSANGVNTSITLDTTNEKLGTGAYSFNGSSSKVVLGSASDWTFLSDATSNTWSIAWWMIYDDTLASGHTIMSTTDGSTQTDGMFIDNSGSGTLRLIQVDGNNGSWSSAIPDNTSWHHYAITWNAGTVTLYVDGVSKGTQSQTAGSGTPQYGLTLGANNDEYYTELTLDEMGIWKRVLTTSEISALYNSGTGSIVTEAKDATWTYPPEGIDSSGQIAQLSGSDSSNSFTAASEFYTISTDTWDSAFNLSGGGRARAGSAGSTEHAYLMGGQNGGGYFGTIDKVAWADKTNTTISRSTRAWGNTVSNAISVCVGQSYYSGSYSTGINEYTYGTMAETSQGNTSSAHPFGGSFGNSTYGFVVNGANTGIERYTYSDKSKTASGFTASPTTTNSGGHTGNSTTGISINNTAGSGNARYDSYNISADTWTTGSATSSTPYEDGRASGSSTWNLWSTQTNRSSARSCEKYNYSSGALSSFTSVATNLDGGDGSESGVSSINTGVNS